MTAVADYTVGPCFGPVSLNILLGSTEKGRYVELGGIFSACSRCVTKHIVDARTGKLAVKSEGADLNSRSGTI